MRYDHRNREIPDNTPVALPVGYNAPETLAETIQRMVKNNEYLKHFDGAETEEEANDFEVDGNDDLMFASPHQFNDMQEEFLDNPPEPETNTVETPKETPVEPPKETEKVDNPVPSTVS